jgi:hypothetical protein
LTRVTTAMGNLLLHGCVAGMIGTSHRWYVPCYALFALCLADGNTSLVGYYYLSSHMHTPIRKTLQWLWLLIVCRCIH